MIMVTGGATNPGPGQLCHTNEDDPNPQLTITYPCGLGLSSVVVTNRQDCCMEPINNFALDMVAGTGEVQQTFTFTGGARSYTFNRRR